MKIKKKVHFACEPTSAVMHLPELPSYPLRTYDKIRYADTDRQGHVNNAVFATFLETGRVEFLYDLENPLFTEQGSFVIASLQIELRKEITWPGIVEIGTGVTHIGNSSMKLKQGLFQRGECVAIAETVIVQVDNATGKSQPLSAGAKERLRSWVISVKGQ